MSEVEENAGLVIGFQAPIERKPWRAPKVIVSEAQRAENGPDNVKTDTDAESAS